MNHERSIPEPESFVGVRPRIYVLRRMQHKRGDRCIEQKLIVGIRTAEFANLFPGSSPAVRVEFLGRSYRQWNTYSHVELVGFIERKKCRCCQHARNA